MVRERSAKVSGRNPVLPAEAAGTASADESAQREVIAVIRLSSPKTREFWQIPVLYEDAHLLALEKPAGLLTSPDRYDPNQPNLMKLLHTAIAERKPWARERTLTYLANAHRLDFQTSGIILLARTKEALVRLAND